MGSYVLDFQEIDQTQVAAVGGKGAQLGELSRIEGINVPAGFCVTTDAFRRIMAEAPSIDERLDRLSHLDPDDREAIRTLSVEMRRTLEGIAIPDDLAAAITRSVADIGEQTAYAVRSSATAEDLPTASFAGQQDTYLNIEGSAAILEHISRIWASLFTERAVTYRLRNGFDHRNVNMAVVVQRMVFPVASGVLFTADPLTSNRKVSSVEATFGLGESLVSGLVNADIYKVRDGEVVEKAVATKELAIRASPAGGTKEESIEPERQKQPALTDAEVVRLEQLGRRIEAHFGYPQDIEWCLVDEEFQIVQTRPITTLFPIPTAGDQENHVYLSVGHAQMMTDAMKPLGLSLWQLTTPRPMYVAGGRLFVDVALGLASPASRAGLLEVFGKSDPLVGDALQDRPRTRRLHPHPPGPESKRDADGGVPAPIETDSAIVTELIERSEASVAKLKSDIRGKSGSALLDFILEDIQELRRILFDPRSHQVFMSAMEATWWLNEQLQAWLGEKNAADTLDAVRPPQRHVGNGTGAHGRRGPDPPTYRRWWLFWNTSRTRGSWTSWHTLRAARKCRTPSRPSSTRTACDASARSTSRGHVGANAPPRCVPVILGNIKSFEPGAGERRFEQGRQEAWTKERDLLERLRALPDGERKADETKEKIDRVRTFIGYREYPKFGMVSRYFVYKRALLEEAGRLAQAHVLGETEDIFYLTFQELHEVVRTKHVDDQLISQRKEAFRSYQALTPPRVLTSDGEVVAGTYRRDDVPTGALVGLPVSAGTIEGRARVVLDMAEADLEAGDILVTAYTDPSWTPVFLAIAGLVTEVGGLMTHGAVIAREYGLPAVVGVEQATRLIRDGQQIRVNGTDGYVEILP